MYFLIMLQEVNSPMRDSEESSFRRMSLEEKWKHVNGQVRSLSLSKKNFIFSLDNKSLKKLSLMYTIGYK